MLNTLLTPLDGSRQSLAALDFAGALARHHGSKLIILHVQYRTEFGAQVMRAADLDSMLQTEGGVPTHPHNSYLEILLDAGLFGLIVCLTALGAFFRAGLKLMRAPGDPMLQAVGTVAVIGVVTELTVGMAGSSFFPTQSTVPYLCCWACAMRAHAQVQVHGFPSVQASTQQNWRTAPRRPLVTG